MISASVLWLVAIVCLFTFAMRFLSLAFMPDVKKDWVERLNAQSKVAESHREDIENLRDETKLLEEKLSDLKDAKGGYR